MPNERERRPRTASGTTSLVHLQGTSGEGIKGYMIVNNYEDGRPCEMFLKIAKQGGTISGFADGLSVVFSHALQRGVPIAELCDALIGLRFEPTGTTDDPEIPEALSILDYVGKRLALDYCTEEERAGFWS